MDEVTQKGGGEVLWKSNYQNVRNAKEVSWSLSPIMGERAQQSIIRLGFVLTLTVVSI